MYQQTERQFLVISCRKHVHAIDHFALEPLNNAQFT